MTRPAENILEDILDRLEGSAGSGVEQLTADSIADAIRKGQKTNRTQQSTSEFDSLAGAAGTAAEGLIKANDASQATVLTGGFKSLGTKILPGFGFAISLAADGAQKFYEFMNENLQMYKQLNTSGLQTTNGMMGLYGSLATARLSMTEFNNAIAGSNDVLASMGADGSEQFGSMLNSVMQTEQSMGSLNMTNEQMGKYLASNLKTQKAYGIFERMNQQQQDASNRSYMENLNKYSKSLGISTDKLAQQLAESSDNVTGFGTQLALTERGMDPQAAAKSSQNLNMVLSSFGGFGDAMNQQLARFIEFGQVDLDSNIGKMYQTNDQIRGLFSNMAKMAKDGTLATEQGKRQLQAMLADDGLVSAIDGNMTNFRAAFGDNATNQIIQWRNQLNNYNADVDKVDSFWNETMNNFNRTIESMFFGFKKGVADMFIDPQGFIKNMFGEKWGSWLLDGAFSWDVSDMPLVGSLTEFLSTFFAPVSWFWDALQGYGSGVAERFGSVEQPSWQNIVRALVPDWLADIIFDQAGDIASPVDMGMKIADGVDKLADDTVNWLSESSKTFTKYQGKLGKAAVATTNDVMSSISKWWNKPSAQTTIQKTVTQNNRTITKPVQIEQPQTEKAPNEILDALRELKQNDLEETLQKLIEQMRRTGDASEKQVSILRKQLNLTDTVQAN